jgi:hypothetical protein
MKIPPARVAAVLGFCLFMAPLWMAASPFLWFIRDEEPMNWIPQTVAGSLLIGIVYWLLARLRGKAPSMAFAVLIPAIGVVGFAHVAPLTQPFYQSYYYDVFSYTYTGLIWIYLFAPYFSIPLALLHAYLMRLALTRTRASRPS